MANELKLIACRGCGMVMVKLSRDICQGCFQKEEDLFISVRDYVRTNPKCKVGEIAEALDVRVEQVNYFIKTGRLERTGVNVEHPCQTCGRVISTGLICPDCSDDLKKHVGDLKSSIADLKKKGNALWNTDKRIEDLKKPDKDYGGKGS